MQVAKWGNSLAVRLPAAVVEALELKVGDDIAIRAESRRDFVIERQPTRDELIKRLDALRFRMPADYKFDREEANER
ncbi:MAG TPA: AbrB/MazE/SpoVT family DNA-binding domain-containing protein [Asticcacaulis sp.]|jgi:antitoxin MazE